MSFKKLVPASLRCRIRAQVNALEARRRARLSYNEIAIEQALECRSVRDATVLVVGANTGEDCGKFLRRGAAAVHGLDVVADIGSNFIDKRVHYHRESIEKTSLPSRMFDMVFSVATMEHVPDIEAGFSEMARVLKPGGLLFSMAAPLWQSPWGHHMSCFDDHPWVHLIFREEELVAYSKANHINSDRGHPIEGVARYMLDPSNFNMKPGLSYLAASDMSDLEIVENQLHMEPSDILEHPLGQRALANGFIAENLLGTQHRLIARKRAG